MEEQVDRVEQKMSRNLLTSSKYSAYKGLGAAMAAELMMFFWFGIGVILAVKTVQSLEYCTEELISRK